MHSRTEEEHDSEDALPLLRRIELYLRKKRMTPSRFGRDAVGDPRFVHDLRRGREPRARTLARVNAWLDEAEKD